MHLPFCPGLTFEAGRFHTILGPPGCVAAFLAEPTTARFPAACICPDTSVLAGDSMRLGIRCRLIRVRSARELLRQLEDARETLIVVEHAPALYGDDGAALRALAHHLRARSACAMVVLYTRVPDSAFARLAGRADRSFAFISDEAVIPIQRRITSPGQTTLT